MSSPSSYLYGKSPLPSRTSKTRSGQIVKYWSDSEGRYAHELDFGSCGHNEEQMAKLDYALAQNHPMKLYTEITISYLRQMMSCPCYQRPVCSRYWMRKMGSGTYSWMSQAALLLPLEHPGEAIGGFACRSVYPQLQRRLRGGMILHLKAYQGRRLSQTTSCWCSEQETLMRKHSKIMTETCEKC